MAKCVRKMEWILLHIKHILYMQPFGALKIAAAKYWKQKWHKSGAARLGSGFCAIYVVIYLYKRAEHRLK